MAEKMPEGEFYSRLYTQHGAPLEDSARFRNRVGAFFYSQINPDKNALGPLIGPQIEYETGYTGFRRPHYYGLQFEEFFRTAPLADAFTAITIIWRQLARDPVRPYLPGLWQGFVERTLAEENLKYRVDPRCGLHPAVDQEFARNRLSALASLADTRFVAVLHAAEAAFNQLNTVPMDGKSAARSIFEAAESTVKIVCGRNADLTEGLVDKELRPLRDRLFANDVQLKMLVGPLISSFAKWVAAVHPYRHGHAREVPLVLPDDLAILVVSQGASFIRWLVDLDRRNR